MLWNIKNIAWFGCVIGGFKMKAHKKDSYHGVHAWIGVGREIKGHDELMMMALMMIMMNVHVR